MQSLCAQSKVSLCSARVPVRFGTYALKPLPTQRSWTSTYQFAGNAQRYHHNCKSSSNDNGSIIDKLWNKVPPNVQNGLIWSAIFAGVIAMPFMQPAQLWTSSSTEAPQQEAPTVTVATPIDRRAELKAKYEPPMSTVEDYVNYFFSPAAVTSKENRVMRLCVSAFIILFVASVLAYIIETTIKAVRMLVFPPTSGSDKK